MRDAITAIGLLTGALIALAFLEDEDDDALPTCPPTIPDWMLLS